MFVYGVQMKRRRGRRQARSRAPIDPLASLFEQRAESKPAPAPTPAQEISAPVVRIADHVERLAYTRTQAAAALGISPATFARRVLPHIETLQMPWGTLLIPVDELERLASERRRPPRSRPRTKTTGRRPSCSAELVAHIRAEHASGKSLGQIARDLNADAVPTAHNGVQWWPSTVHAVLNGRTAAQIAAQHEPQTP
jgi:hypothetical protein